MHKNLLYAVLLLAITFFTISNSSGPGAVTGRDRTGSPLASGDCSACHTGGDYGTEVSASLLLDTSEVSEYIPGQAYTLQIRINTSTPPERFGFQAVALTGEANLNAGSFSDAPVSTRLIDLDNRTYFEHATKLETEVIEVPWTAPEAGTGDVRFYAAGNAVNNANGSGGDDSDVLDIPLTITEGTATSLQVTSQLEIDWQVFPNPATDEVRVRLQPSQTKDLSLRLLDARGLILQSQPLSFFSGDVSLSLKDLTSGLYFLQVYNKEGVATKRFLKVD